MTQTSTTRDRIRTLAQRNLRGTATDAERAELRRLMTPSAPTRKPRGWYDLPIAAAMWREDARRVEARCPHHDPRDDRRETMTTYDIRQPGMTSYATAATLDEARTLLAEARDKGLRARCYVDGTAVDGVLDRDDDALAYDILRGFGAHCPDGADAESVALAERATDGRGVRAYGAEGAGLSDDHAAIAECLRMLALCELASEES